MIKVFAAFILLPLSLQAADGWEQALAGMPMPSKVVELNRTNCVGLMLAAFQEHPVVKALVFMPGATDEFYMFRRAKAGLTNTNPTLLDAVNALTNQTLIRATFHPPMLLLHTDEDPLDAIIRIDDEPRAKKLQNASFPRHLVCNDRDWNYIQPILKKTFHLDVRPWRHSYDSWHFYRHSFAEWNLDAWEALQAVALAGKTTFTVQKHRLLFEGDERVRTTPKVETFPR